MAETSGAEQSVAGGPDGSAGEGRQEAALLLWETFHGLGHVVRRELGRLLRPHGLVSPFQVGLLAALVRAGPLRLVDLSRQLDLPTSTLSEWIDRLVATGCVSREQDPRDRRAVALAVTPAGRVALAELAQQIPRMLAARLMALEDHEVAQLVAGLRPLRRITGDGRACP